MQQEVSGKQSESRTLLEAAVKAGLQSGGPVKASKPTPDFGTIEDILDARQKTHGDFTDNARVMQGLKRVVWNEKGWDSLSDVQREAIEMILHKVGRIISGDPNEPDHWDDIAGYAKLVSRRLTL